MIRSARKLSRSTSRLGVQHSGLGIGLDVLVCDDLTLQLSPKGPEALEHN